MLRVPNEFGMLEYPNIVIYYFTEFLKELLHL